MNKKIIITIGILIVIVISTVIIKNSSKTETTYTNNEQSYLPPRNDTLASTTEQENANVVPIEIPKGIPKDDDPALHIGYNDEGFAPDTVTVKVGDIVIFDNNSSRNFWPASNNHPTHSIYSEFDAKKSILPGGSYSFTFTKAGTWGYHDHIKVGKTGTVIVK